MNKLSILALAIAVIALGGYAFPRAGHALVGGITNYDTVSATGLQIGSSCNSSFGTCTGTTVTQMNSGVCALANDAANTPIQASSTAVFTCTATGVTAGDRVLVTPNYPTGTATSTFSQNAIAGMTFRAASSTAANTITVYLFNNTGAATSSITQATSSWTWYSFR